MTRIRIIAPVVLFLVPIHEFLVFYVLFFKALLAIAGGVVGYFYKEFSDSDYKKKDAIEFFLAAVGIAAGVAIIFFLIFLTGIHKKINLVWTKTVLQLY